LAWVGITGVTLRGRIRLRDDTEGHTKVTFRLSYQAPSGVMGYIADRIAVRFAAVTVRRQVPLSLGVYFGQYSLMLTPTK
jgi:uncharacterized membrane protein